MGEAGAQLPGSRNSAAHAAARRIISGWCSSTRKRRSCRSARRMPANIQHAIDSVRASRLRGGTDLQRALQAGLQQAVRAGSEQYVSRHPERRRRDARSHSEWKTGRLVCIRVEAAPRDAAPAHLHSGRRRRCQPAAVPHARPAGRTARTRALDRADGIQAEFVSLEDRPQPSRPARSLRDAGVCGRYGLPAAGRDVLRIAGLVGGPLPEAAGERQLHGARRARRRRRCR